MSSKFTSTEILFLRIRRQGLAKAIPDIPNYLSQSHFVLHLLMMVNFHNIQPINQNGGYHRKRTSQPPFHNRFCKNGKVSISDRNQPIIFLLHRLMQNTEGSFQDVDYVHQRQFLWLITYYMKMRMDERMGFIYYFFNENTQALFIILFI